jgi:hypothetical protein
VRNTAREAEGMVSSIVHQTQAAAIIKIAATAIVSTPIIPLTYFVDELCLLWSETIDG